LYEVKAVVVICVSAVADRFHGYLRSVMLNVHPGVFLSMDLDAGTRGRVFETVERWWNDEPRGSIVMIWKNTADRWKSRSGIWANPSGMSSNTMGSWEYDVHSAKIAG
jgi:CRISPR-associated endoribonuclease Cas2 subtype I-E